MARRINPDNWIDDYGDALYGYALMRVREPSVAEDLVQETFLAALTARENFAGQSSEKTWLTGILKHKLIDHLRRRHRDVQVDDIEAISDLNAHSFDDRDHWRVGIETWRDPDSAMQHEQFWAVLTGCVSALPERLAQLYVLREIDGVESDEVCQLLGITTKNNLWVMLSRTRMRLRDCMDQNWFNNGRIQGG